MRRRRNSEDVATEPCIARGDDASERCWQEKIKRKFVFQKMVAVQIAVTE